MPRLLLSSVAICCTANAFLQHPEAECLIAHRSHLKTLLPQPISTVPQRILWPYGDATRPSTHIMTVIDLQQRHIQGRSNFSTMFRTWLKLCRLSYSQMMLLSEWATHGKKWLCTSQLNKLNHNRIYSPSLHLFDALGSVNEAVWSWHVTGDAATRQRFGPLPRPLTARMINACQWIPSAADPDQPMGQLELIAIFVGIQDPPQMMQHVIGDDEAAVISDAIGRRLDSWLAAKGGVRAGFRELLSLYDVADVDRIEMLRNVVIGAAVYTSEELEAELPALCWLFSAIEQQELNRQGLLTLLASPDATDHQPAKPQTPRRSQSIPRQR